jgi:hypothetical protein
LTGFAAPDGGKRILPRTLPSHPGNIFLTGEPIVVAEPPGQVDTWRVVDYDNKVVAKGNFQNGFAKVSPLPVGIYKIVRGVGQITNRAWIGVLEPLHAPTPKTSPIAVEVGMAWFFPAKEKMKEVTSLCQLAGINRVRDRLLWEKMEPKRGVFSGRNEYDDSAEVQSDGGLQILQVNHLSPTWANPNIKHFPPDLRDVYDFYREMARRWKNEIGAFEPWNEAELEMFGGHTGSEMATLQKAAYLGLKAGNPNVIACENVFAIRRPETLADFAANKATAYFDTYNLHHYEPLANYPALYAAHRANSGGKPMWVSECSVHVKWSGSDALKELNDKNLRLQSEQLTKTYALAIHEGAKAVFYFVLPDYTEARLQYGLLHADLTPRPGYVALAAVGRLLADAQPSGRLKTKADDVQGYLFDAKPDGKNSKVLVIWSGNETSIELPEEPEKCFDHLGREKSIDGKKLNLTSAPVYLVFKKNPRLDLLAPPKAPKRVSGKPGKIILQALPPEERIVVNKSAYKFAMGRTNEVPIFLYNFGTKPSHGKLRVNVPENWRAEFPSEANIAPGERKELKLQIFSPDTNWTNATVKISGDFSSAEKPLLSFRFVPEKTE